MHLCERFFIHFAIFTILPSHPQNTTDDLLTTLAEKIENTNNETKLSTWEKVAEATGKILTTSKEVSYNGK